MRQKLGFEIGISANRCHKVLVCGSLCWRVELDWAHFYRNVAYFSGMVCVGHRRWAYLYRMSVSCRAGLRGQDQSIEDATHLIELSNLLRGKVMVRFCSSSGMSEVEVCTWQGQARAEIDRYWLG